MSFLKNLHVKTIENLLIHRILLQTEWGDNPSWGSGYLGSEVSFGAAEEP
jgi:hypothetical protein